MVDGEEIGLNKSVYYNFKMNKFVLLMDVLMLVLDFVVYEVIINYVVKNIWEGEVVVLGIFIDFIEVYKDVVFVYFMLELYCE